MDKQKQIHNDNKYDIIELSYAILFIALIVRVANICIRRGTTTDCYFLINTGRYIVENKCIPTMNIWTIHQDFKIVIQQWLCCISNYIAYNTANKLGLSTLTIIHMIILNILLIKYTKLWTNNKRIVVLSLCTSNYLASNFMSARPSLVTMSILTYELIQLELWNRSSKSKKDNIKLLINLGLISLFHINYHSALWFMDILFVLPYMVPAIWEFSNIKDIVSSVKNRKTLLMAITSIVIIVVVALINPNKIYAMQYISNSSTMFNIWELDELSPWKLSDTNSIIIILTIILLTIYIVKGGRDKALIYLTSGTIVLSIMYTRNLWMIMFSVVRLLIIYLDKRTPKIHTVSKNKYTILTTVSLLIIVLWAVTLTYQSLESIAGVYDSSYTVDEAVKYLNSLAEDEKDRLVIYNEFGNGAYLELNGYKAYIDARPELYMESINGKADIYQEWVDLQNGIVDIPKFITKYNFNTFVVYNRTVLDCYLYYNDEYEVVVKGNGYKVYRLADNS